MCLLLSRHHPQNAVHILLDNAVFFQLSLDFAVLFVQPRFLLVQLPVLGFQGGQIGQPCDSGVLDGLCRSLVQNELAFMFAPERGLVFGLAVFQHHGPELLVGGEVLYQHRHVPKTMFHIFEGRSRLVVGRADLRDLAFQLGILLYAMLGKEVDCLCGLLQILELRPTCIARALLGLDVVLQVDPQGDTLALPVRASVHGQPLDPAGDGFLGVVLAQGLAAGEAMDIGPLLGLWFQTLVVGLTMNILSICIFLVTYGRMIEIYAVTALGPIPLATLGNAEWRGVGQNYLKSLLALGFQAFLIMVVVGIYAVLIQQIGQAADISGAIWGCMGYTVLLCFCLFKTGSIWSAVRCSTTESLCRKCRN